MIGSNRLGNPQCAEQIGFDLRPGVGFADFLNGSEQAISGIVDRDIDAAEALLRQRDRAKYRRPIRHVEGDRHDPLAEALDQRRQRLQIARSGRDLIARASAACAQTRPKPRDVPVMNQTLCVT